jgi:membrane protein YqaA with SNARE-associated domain
VKTLIAWIQAVALGLGAPGIFVVAFLDSSFLSLPQINDLLLVVSVARAPHLMPLYAAMATLGSIAGCTVMYYIGRKGGEALLRRRFSGSHTERALRLFSRYGVLAIIVPAILPPPAPFKIFVILAGVARMSLPQFWLAVAAGRGLRYFGEGLLAVWYGERAMIFLETHGRAVGLGLGLTVLVGGVAYVFWRSRRRRGAGPSAGQADARSL